MRPSGGGTATVMREDEAETYVLHLLSERGPQTTREIEAAASKERRRCPDRTVLFLSKMMSKGIIQGAVSLERRGWVWSLPSKSR